MKTETGLPAKTGLLLKLSRLYNIQTAYYDNHHKKKSARDETLLAILNSLGAPVASFDDVADACRERRQALCKKFVEPVTIAWEGNLDSVTIQLPDTAIKYRSSLSLTLEDGTQTEWQSSPEDEIILSQIEIENTVYYRKNLSLKKQLPYGYHHLIIETHGHRGETLILSAPVKAYTTDKNERQWGAFIPLYSLHSSNSWGSGNFSDLGKLTGWIAEMGGTSVATLPLLSTFLNRPYEPSPYLPVSRLFWNEFYLDITGIPELSECPDARVFIDSPSFIQTVRSFQNSRLNDYLQQMALKRTILEKLSRHFFSSGSPRYRDFERYVTGQPVLAKYACFRAVMEKQDISWYRWQERLQNGYLENDDYDDQIKRYHLYVQWLVYEQMNNVMKCASDSGVNMCLDLPLGTHPDGFDTWFYRNIFVNSVSVGAPPDIVFTRGQDWTFPPFHPDRIRETGYEYFITCLRHHLKYAKTLRIDHIMSLHRLYFIPKGFESSQGMYVRYHPEEFYAVLSIESHRHHSVIIGEDLGIVPQAVRAAMHRHGLNRMWVMHYELAGKSKPLLRNPRTNSVVSINTHDMPPFASFWKGQDIVDRERTGIITGKTAQKETKSRANVKQNLVDFLKANNLITGRITISSVLKGCLRYLAAGNARLFLINLEDLWLETRTQNIPSTTVEHPNWQRKARLGFDTFCQTAYVMTILREVNRLRSGKERKHVTR